MLKKINITLFALCILGAVCIFGVKFYVSHADVANSAIAQQVGGAL